VICSVVAGYAVIIAYVEVLLGVCEGVGVSFFCIGVSRRAEGEAGVYFYGIYPVSGFEPIGVYYQLQGID